MSNSAPEAAEVDQILELVAAMPDQVDGSELSDGFGPVHKSLEDAAGNEEEVEETDTVKAKAKAKSPKAKAKAKIATEVVPNAKAKAKPKAKKALEKAQKPDNTGPDWQADEDEDEVDFEDEEGGDDMARQLKKQKEMTLDEKMQLFKDGKVSDLHLNKNESCKLMGQLKSKLKQPSYSEKQAEWDAICKLDVRAGKNTQKRKWLLGFIKDPELGNGFQAFKESVGKEQSALQTEKWVSWKTILASYTEEEAWLHVQSGAIKERKHRITEGVMEYCDMTDVTRTTKVVKKEEGKQTVNRQAQGASELAVASNAFQSWNAHGENALGLDIGGMIVHMDASIESTQNAMLGNGWVSSSSSWGSNWQGWDWGASNSQSSLQGSNPQIAWTAATPVAKAKAKEEPAPANMDEAHAKCKKMCTLLHGKNMAMEAAVEAAQSEDCLTETKAKDAEASRKALVKEEAALKNAFLKAGKQETLEQLKDRLVRCASVAKAADSTIKMLKGTVKACTASQAGD